MQKAIARAKCYIELPDALERMLKESRFSIEGEL
jgi:hypothetical protein